MIRLRFAGVYVCVECEMAFSCRTVSIAVYVYF